MSQPPPLFDDFEITITSEEPPALGANVTVRYADATETGSFSLSAVAEAVRQLNAGLSLAQPASAVAEATGGVLFDALFAGRLFRTYTKAATLAVERGHRLRLRLMTERPALVAIPWEYLYDRDLERWLALHRDLSLVRALPGAVSDPTPVAGLLRVLVMIADPTDLPALDTTAEWANLEAVADVAAIELIPIKPTYEALLGALRQQPHVFHFVGHGDFDAVNQQGFLCFRSADGTADRIPADQLATALADCQSLRLALLNACRGATAGDRSAFAGVAQKLIQQGLPAVIAMQAPILDDHALRFSQEFYRALADGYTVEQAVGEGRKRIYEVDASWGIPALYFQGGELFTIPVLSNEQKAARLWQKVQGVSDLARRRALIAQVLTLDPAHRAARKAQQEFANAVEAERLYGVAQTYYQSQQWREAYRTLEQVRRLDPNLRDTWRLLKVVKDKLDSKTVDSGAVDSRLAGALNDAQAQEYEPMLEALKEGQLVPFLGWDVSRIGRPLTDSWAPGESSPGADEIAAALAEPLRQHLTSPVSIPQISQYAVLINGPAMLYRRLRNLYTQPAPPTILHDLLAELPRRLQGKQFWKNAEERFIVFTAAFDDLLERAFVAAGQPFHLLAYCHRQIENGVELPARFLHVPPDGAPIEIPDPATYDVHEHEAENVYHPIIVKLCGLRPTEEPGSVLLTEDQFLEYLAGKEQLPTSLLKQIKQRSFVFFGYSMQPWHFRVLWQRIRPPHFQFSEKKWAIVNEMSRIDEEFWRSQEVTPLVAAPEDVVVYINSWLDKL